MKTEWHKAIFRLYYSTLEVGLCDIPVHVGKYSDLKA